MKITTSRIILTALISAAGTAAFAEDVRLGGGRAFGMAGAGIALPLDVYENHRLNPALLGFAGEKFRFGIPYIGYHAKRISLKGVQDLIGDIDSGGIEDDQVVKLARKYGSNTKEFGVNGGLGVSGGHFALSGGAEAIVRSVPNAQLKAFLATGDNDYNNAPIDSRLDAYGLGYYEMNASYGHEVLKGADRLSVGATVRGVSAYYAHKVADAEAIAGNGDVRNGSEVADGDDVIKRSGVGVDLGAVGTLRKLPNAYYGVNIRNLVEPNIRFVRTFPNTDFPLRRDLRPFQREINVGTAYVQGRYLAAADMIDLGNHAGHAGFRVGGEYAFSKYLAIRGGYDSRSKFVVGLCLGGVNAAVSADGSTSIVTAIRF
jgi:hypothetical protein